MVSRLWWKYRCGFRSFYDLIRAFEQRWRDREIERLRGLRVVANCSHTMGPLSAERHGESCKDQRGVSEKSKAFRRLFAAASRLPRGARFHRVSMSFKIETVS